MTPALQALVVRRAGNRCEYCRMHQALQGAAFHVDHVIPRSLGGRTTRGNLAWTRPQCNLRKSNRVTGLDPVDGVEVALFHPRRDAWKLHFEWQGYALLGTTPTGRATVAALQLNHERRIRVRRAKEQYGLFPPP